jgi:uncharacterized protein (DUF1778 family)
MPAQTHSQKLDLRLTPQVKRTLSAAAAAAHQSVSEFVLASALARAQEVLPDRQHIGLDAETWARFMAALDAPARDLPRMAPLLVRPGLFDV